MITKTWKVQQLDCYPQYNEATEVVFNVHWTLTANENDYVGFCYGSTNVSLDLTDGFTPFDQLTEAQVLGWVHAEMGEAQVAAFEANVEQQITDQTNPPVVSPPLPWAAAAE